MAPAHFRLVRFAILTGLRREVQFSLSWSNVDHRNKVLTFPRSKHEDTRHVPLSNKAMEILKAIRSEMRGMTFWFFPSLNPLTYLDTQKFYKRVYLPALEKSGIREGVWHTLCKPSRHGRSRHQDGAEDHGPQNAYHDHAIFPSVQWSSFQGDQSDFKRGDLGRNGHQNGKARKCRFEGCALSA